MAQGKRPELISAKAVSDIGKMVVATLMFSFITSYWFTPVQGARQVLQFMDDAVTAQFIEAEKEDDSDSGGSQEDDAEQAFNTFWPIVMMLITGIIFIIIVVIVCKRFCSNNGRPEWGPRNRSLSLEGVRNSQTPTADRESRDQPPPLDDRIWSVNISMDDSIPEPSHLKPPPYCDKPPSYDDIGDIFDLPKYNTDNFEFGADDSLHELSESTSDLGSSSTSGMSSRGSTPRGNSPRRYHTSISSCPNEPPPVYEPPTSGSAILANEENTSGHSRHEHVLSESSQAGVTDTQFDIL